MGIEERVVGMVRSVVADLVRGGGLPAEASAASFSVDRPKRPEHGDLATNVALALQKLAKKPPRDLAKLFHDRLEKLPGIRSVGVEGPGFLNLRLENRMFHDVLGEVFAAGRGYGRGPAATGERILLEFVSANPTGPLLISHGRGAILGDALATLLEAVGHRVTREYYVNDYGNQVRLLGESVLASLAGQPPPEGGYGGYYVKEVAAWVSARNPQAIADRDVAAISRAAVTRILDGTDAAETMVPGIKRTLASIRVTHDVWTSEDSFHRWGRVETALEKLRAGGWLEDRDGAVFFKSTDAGDDKDRVVRKSDGATTYFASDIAYHADKVARGYDRLLTVLGADHHGYTLRVRAALGALGLPSERFDVVLFQLVNLLRDGKPVKMGKRLGNGITIEEVVEEIDEAARRKGAGADALRYFYLARRTDTTIDLDLEVAKKSSLDNPVFYLQYGYARLCSIQRRAAEVYGLATPAFDAALAGRLVHPDELAILARLGRFPAVVAEAAAGREPHLVLFFLRDLSQDFQSYFTRLKGEGDAILPLGSQTAKAGWEATWDREKSLARLLWIEGIRSVYAAGLRLLGITALERMEKLEQPGALEADEPTG